jgi:hypothetical protein
MPEDSDNRSAELIENCLGIFFNSLEWRSMGLLRGNLPLPHQRTSNVHDSSSP